MANEWHVEWLKEGGKRWNARRKKVQFIPDLKGIRFYDHLPRDFRDAPKTSRYFERFDLSHSDLQGADLSDLNFARSNFSNANMSRADLRKSNFEGCKFRGTDLTNADATRSLFDGAVFEKATLLETIIEEAEFLGAVVIEVAQPLQQIEYMQAQGASVFESKSEYQRVSTDERFSSAAHDRARSIDFVPREDTRTEKVKYDVYFCTSRNPILERGAVTDFGDTISDKLHYGLSEVIVPPESRIGSIGTWLWRKLRNKSSSELRMQSLIPLNEELYWQHLVRTADKMKEKAAPTIFVHGYNTSFQEAVLRAAKLGHDLGIGQGVGLFSWPSKGKTNAYAADEATVEMSKYMLAEFLEGFVENGSDQGINIIAHSMGCRCLIGAIEVLAGRQSAALSGIDQVVLAAADVDANIMPHSGVHAANHSERLTSYVSNKDKALQLSGWLHSYPRVGHTPPTFVLNGMDTIVVNDLDLGSFSHNYVSSSRTILTDIFNVLKHGLSPPDRHGIEAVLEGELEYWRIRN